MATTEPTDTSADTDTDTSSASGAIGRIEEIKGVVIEAVFPDKLPEINSAIVIKRESNPSEDEKLSGGISSDLVCEVQQHLGDDRVRQAEITQEIMEVVSGAEALT